MNAMAQAILLVGVIAIGAVLVINGFPGGWWLISGMAALVLCGAFSNE